jgi:hypothetical protein
MAKPILESNGLSMVPFEQRHVQPFVSDLSPENLREFETLYEVSAYEALSGVVGEALVFAVELDGVPVAVTGLTLQKHDGQMWALFSNQLRKKFVSFVKFSYKLVGFYHTLTPDIRADIWTENHMIHQWAVHLGFVPVCDIEMQNGQTVVRFVRCNPRATHAHGSTSRPVLH